jgi:hypothetical protein
MSASRYLGPLSLPKLRIRPPKRNPASEKITEMANKTYTQKTWNPSIPIVFAAMATPAGRKSSAWNEGYPIVFSAGLVMERPRKGENKSWDMSKPILFSTSTLSVCHGCRKTSLDSVQRVSRPTAQKRHRVTTTPAKVDRMQQLLLDAEDEVVTETKEEEIRRKAEARHQALFKKSLPLRRELQALLATQQKDVQACVDILKAQRERVANAQRQDLTALIAMLEGVLKEQWQFIEELAAISKSKTQHIKQRRQFRAAFKHFLGTATKRTKEMEETLRATTLSLKSTPSLVRHQLVSRLLVAAVERIALLRIQVVQKALHDVKMKFRSGLTQASFEREISNLVQKRRSQIALVVRNWGSLKWLAAREWSRSMVRGSLEDMSALIKIYEKYARRQEHRSYSRPISPYQSPWRFHRRAWQLQYMAFAMNANGVEAEWHNYGVLRRKLRARSLFHARYSRIQSSALSMRAVADEIDFFWRLTLALPEFPSKTSGVTRRSLRKSVGDLVIQSTLLAHIAVGLIDHLIQGWQLSHSKRFFVKEQRILNQLTKLVRMVHLHSEDTLILASRGLIPAPQQATPLNRDSIRDIRWLEDSLNEFQLTSDISDDPESLRLGHEYLLSRQAESYKSHIKSILKLCSKHELQIPNDLIAFALRVSDPADGTLEHGLSPRRKSQTSGEKYVPFGKDGFQMVTQTLDKSSKSKDEKPALYSYSHYRNTKGEAVSLHYCTTKDQCERVAKLFLDEKVIGFDLEWKAQAKSTDSIKLNVSLVQVASESRVALFHLAVGKGDSPQELLAPSLIKLIESEDIIKCGVCIGGDGTRMAKFYGVQPRKLFDVSGYHNLLMDNRTKSGEITRHRVSLDKLVSQHLGIIMDKGDVRTSDWSIRLSHEQCKYAASDAYASLHLFYKLEDSCRDRGLDPKRSDWFVEAKLPISAQAQSVHATVAAKSVSNEELKQDEDKEMTQKPLKSLWKVLTSAFSGSEAEDEPSIVKSTQRHLRHRKTSRRPAQSTATVPAAKFAIAALTAQRRKGKPNAAGGANESQSVISKLTNLQSQQADTDLEMDELSEDGWSSRSDERGLADISSNESSSDKDSTRQRLSIPKSMVSKTIRFGRRSVRPLSQRRWASTQASPVSSRNDDDSGWESESSVSTRSASSQDADLLAAILALNASSQRAAKLLGRGQSLLHIPGNPISESGVEDYKLWEDFDEEEDEDEDEDDEDEVDDWNEEEDDEADVDDEDVEEEDDDDDD